MGSEVVVVSGAVEESDIGVGLGLAVGGAKGPPGVSEVGAPENGEGGAPEKGEGGAPGDGEGGVAGFCAGECAVAG